jgi:hypothetical protein
VDLVLGPEHRVRAATVRQVNGKKLPDNLIVEVRQESLFQTEPACEVSYGADIAVLSLPGISAVAKISKERGNMRIQYALPKPAKHLWMRDDCFIHDDLQCGKFRIKRP